MEQIRRRVVCVGHAALPRKIRFGGHRAYRQSRAAAPVARQSGGTAAHGRNVAAKSVQSEHPENVPQRTGATSLPAQRYGRERPHARAVARLLFVLYQHPKTIGKHTAQPHQRGEVLLRASAAPRAVFLRDTATKKAVAATESDTRQGHQTLV